VTLREERRRDSERAVEDVRTRPSGVRRRRRLTEDAVRPREATVLLHRDPWVDVPLGVLRGRRLGRIAAVDRSRPAGGLRRSSTARPGGWRSTSRWQGTCDSRVWTRSRSVTATPPVPFPVDSLEFDDGGVVGGLLVVVLDFEREAAALAGGEVRQGSRRRRSRRPTSR